MNIFQKVKTLLKLRPAANNFQAALEKDGDIAMFGKVWAFFDGKKTVIGAGLHLGGVVASALGAPPEVITALDWASNFFLTTGLFHKAVKEVL